MIDRFGIVARARRYVSWRDRWSGSRGTRIDLGREILDLQNLIVWQQQPAHLGDVQPAIRRALHRAIVKIEAVNVDIDFHSS